MAANTDLSGQSSIYKQGTTPQTRHVISSKAIIKTPHYNQGPALSQIGLVGNFTSSESRSNEETKGIGFGDMIAEIVPGPTQHMTLQFDRTMLYLCNLWQATGYASGVSGPVRSLRHHRWPFDVEESLVFSTVADMALGKAGVGFQGGKGSFQGGAVKLDFPAVTDDLSGKPGNSRGHTALITYYEACWFNSGGHAYSKDSAIVTENGSADVTDCHDFSTQYGEFLATGNDPTLDPQKQFGSIRYK